MRWFILTLLLVIVVVVGLGFYLGWWGISARRDAATNDLRVTLDINRGKIEQDAKKAREQVAKAGQRVAEGAKEAARTVGAAVQPNHQAKGRVVKVAEAEARLTIHTED